MQKQGKVKTSSAIKSAPAGQELHPWIGKRIKLKWSEDGISEFYESVICDYKPETVSFCNDSANEMQFLRLQLWCRTNLV